MALAPGKLVDTGRGRTMVRELVWRVYVVTCTSAVTVLAFASPVCEPWPSSPLPGLQVHAVNFCSK
jgi:hypothetical protein